jgi:hypothetical protein
MTLSFPPFIRSFRRWVVLFLAVYVALITSWGVAPQYPQDGLDPSWEQAMVDATDHRRVFGTEVIFTYGPLHQALTAQVSRDWTAFLAGRIAFSLCWFLVVLLSGRLMGLRAAAAIAIAVSLTPVSEVHFYLLAFLGVVMGFRVHGDASTTDRCGLLLAGTLACACTLATLVKLSFLGAAAPALLVLLGIPILRIILRRESPSLGVAGLLLAPLALLVLVWGLTVNWSPRAFLGYFLGPNLDIIQGYSSAMAYPSSALAWTLVGIYLLLSTYSLGLFWKLQARGEPRDAGNSNGLPLAAWVALLAFGVLFWVVGKSSFVRGDPWHTRIAAFWGIGALIILLALPSVRLRAFFRNYSRPLCAIVFLVPFGLGALLLPSAEESLGLRWIKHRLSGSLENLRWFTSAGRNVAGAARAAAFDRIQEATEDFLIPRGATADILPWDVSPLLAQGLRYSPRPIPQSYSAYTPRLQRLNRDFILASSARPEYVVVAVKDIDGRLPIGLDSPLLLHLHRGYEFHHRGEQGSLVFRRRDGSLAATEPRMETVVSGSLAWSRRYRYIWSSAPIPIPAQASGPLVLSARFREGASRMLLSKLYRPFPVQIEYLDGAGKVVAQARFIPEAVEEMLVYPVVRTNEELLRLLNPAQSLPGLAGTGGIVAFRFTVTDFGTPFAETEFSLMAYSPQKGSRLSGELAAYSGDPSESDHP